MCDAYFESKQMRITGVLSGTARMCRDASATAVSSAVLFVRTVAPRCSGSEGVTDTGPKSCVCVSVDKGVSAGEGWVKCTPQPAVGEVPHLMLALINEPSVHMSVRVLGTIEGVELMGVSWVGASGGGGS